MFDNLRIADRLKRSGFEDRQAEGMARVLSEVTGKLLERLATKSDLAATNSDLETRFGGLGSDFVALRAEFAALSAKFDALNAKVDALGTQIRFMFGLLAVLVALGLVDIVPGLLG